MNSIHATTTIDTGFVYRSPRHHHIPERAKASLRESAPLLSRMTGAISKLGSAFKFEIAEGYQDESGFHYGVKPVEKKISWPPVG